MVINDIVVEIKPVVVPVDDTKRMMDWLGAQLCGRIHK